MEKKERYFGSVRFYKNMILLVIFLTIGILLFIAIRQGKKADAARSSLAEMQAEEQRRQEELAAAEALARPLPEKQRPKDELSAQAILMQSPVVMHAMGTADGAAMLNCREGFEEHYAQGVRVFEADLRLTSDGHVVLRHDWRSGWQEGVSDSAVPTLEEFLSQPILGRYTPMSFRDLLLLMEEHPDVCVVTDTKFWDSDVVTMQFTAMLDDAHQLGLSYLFDRMFIQLYTQAMFETVNALYAFPHYIYTFYAEGFSDTEEDLRARLDFCRAHGIAGVTMWDYWWQPSFGAIVQEYGLFACVHTVNDAAAAKAFLSSGVHAVYTDSLVPGDL